jgi:hypothetical protein
MNLGTGSKLRSLQLRRFWHSARARVDKVIVYADGQVIVQGAIDGSEACLIKQNELPVP